MSGENDRGVRAAFFEGFDPGPIKARLTCDTMEAHVRGEAAIARLLDRRLGCPRFARLRLCFAELLAKLRPFPAEPRPGRE